MSEADFCADGSGQREETLGVPGLLSFSQQGAGEWPGGTCFEEKGISEQQHGIIFQTATLQASTSPTPSCPYSVVTWQGGKRPFHSSLRFCLLSAGLWVLVTLLTLILPVDLLPPALRPLPSPPHLMAAPLSRRKQAGSTPHSLLPPCSAVGLPDFTSFPVESPDSRSSGIALPPSCTHCLSDPKGRPGPVFPCRPPS